MTRTQTVPGYVGFGNAIADTHDSHVKLWQCKSPAYPAGIANRVA
jgi:hypothetical protein